MTITATNPPSLGVNLAAPRPGGRLPIIIQGGMGVSVSNWELARAVSQAGELGVVSGTAMEVVIARRLQDGDPGGHVRRALAAFPYPHIARAVMRTYYIHGGKEPEAQYRAVPMFTVDPSPELAALTVVSTFVEVWLAKEGHAGAVGINFLRKIELPLPFGLLGAIIAGVDYVLVGAGNPAELPEQIRTLARGDDLRYEIRSQGMTSTDPAVTVLLSPTAILGTKPQPMPQPRFLAIVASVELAAGLAGQPRTRPFGFVVEGPTAGGHNAPPRGPRRTDELGQPIYDDRDKPDLHAIAAVGLPFWLAGSYGSPGGLAAAKAVGAQGIQAGTVFAYCAESGMAAQYKRQVLDQLMSGKLDIRTDWRVSPTGFPFKVVQAPGTISDPEVAAARKAVCDVGALRTPYKKENGGIDYRCPAEPLAVYTGRKGGRAANAEGRRCLCNALLAAAGIPQIRRGVAEPAIITSGDDFTAVAALMRALPSGQEMYHAVAVIQFMRSGVAVAA
jgi:NAD(P)H-dependent flavin oxidoreductase YrpB (nitropropane dioxygenase family)